MIDALLANAGAGVTDRFALSGHERLFWGNAGDGGGGCLFDGTSALTADGETTAVLWDSVARAACAVNDLDRKVASFPSDGRLDQQTQTAARRQHSIPFSQCQRAVLAGPADACLSVALKCLSIANDR